MTHKLSPAVVWASSSLLFFFFFFLFSPDSPSLAHSYLLTQLVSCSQLCFLPLYKEYELVNTAPDCFQSYACFLWLFYFSIVWTKAITLGFYILELWSSKCSLIGASLGSKLYIWKQVTRKFIADKLTIQSKNICVCIYIYISVISESYSVVSDSLQPHGL